MTSSQSKVGPIVLSPCFDGWLTCPADGMLLPPLCTQQEYVQLATSAGLNIFGGPKDISKDVSKTWSALLRFSELRRVF